MFEGFGHLSDDARAVAFVAHMNQVTLRTALRGLTLDEAIQAWFDAQAEPVYMTTPNAKRAAANIERQVTP